MLAGKLWKYAIIHNFSRFTNVDFVQVVYFIAVKKGYARAWYYGDALLYAFSTAAVFHSVSVLTYNNMDDV